MNLLPEVFVKVIATTQAQCVNTPDFLSLSVAETEINMHIALICFAGAERVNYMVSIKVPLSFN